MNQLNQLRMVKLNMSDIPDANVLHEYELRVLRPDEKNKWELLCDKAFEKVAHYDFHNEEESKKGYVADGVIAIFHGDKIIATGTAICNHEQPDGFGYVHNIAADFDYSGKRLGYEVVAAVLRRLRDDGFDKAELTTDDFRLPAIKTYCSLGFIPDLSVDETMRGRWESIYKILGFELSDYI